MHNYLSEILAKKRQAVEQLIVSGNFNRAQSKISKKSFKHCLLNKPAVIAEIKRKSPSKASLAMIADPIVLAKEYVAAGAQAISVLTDPFGFNGSIEDLIKVAHALQNEDVAILQKDFIIHPVQINQAIAAGADAVLLIVAVLGETTQELLTYAKSLGLDVLVEVHTQAELDYAFKIDAEIIGINNRNLTTFSVDINHSMQLIKKIPSSKIAISESGINTAETAQSLISAGFHGVLIGEALVTAKDPKTMIQQIRGIQCKIA